MTHGWKAMNPTIVLRPKKGGLYVVILPEIILSSPCTGMYGRFQTSSYQGNERRIKQLFLNYKKYMLS